MLYKKTWGKADEVQIIVVGTGELAATGLPNRILKTYALGSCVALILLDPICRTVGMAHIALPDSRINAISLNKRPAYFADKGIPALFDEMKRAGGFVSSDSLIIKMVGGASVLDPHKYFNIGKKNILSIKKYLWRYKMGPIAEDLGGDISRTVTVDSTSGIVTVTSHGKGEWTL